MEEGRGSEICEKEYLNIPNFNGTILCSTPHFITNNKE
jgi:hypothetical protein